jgi:uncharacterized membrane protein YphA (DoxX/SURF4 family)
MERLIPALGPRVSVAMLILRLVVGASFILHGAPKMAHPMSWDGPDGPLPGVPGWLQLIVCLAEYVGGWCLIVGLLTPLVTFLQVCDMIVVTFIIGLARGVPYAGPGHTVEIPAHLLAGALVLLVCGPGMFSLDALFVRKRGRLAAPSTGFRR